MLRFIRTMPKSAAAQMVERWLSECFSNTEGVCYYKHPAVVTKAVITNTDEIPHFILFTKTNQPLVVRIIESQLSDIKLVEEDIWEIDDVTCDSPLLVLEDLVVKLENRFQEQRKLRNRLHTQTVLALPFIAKSDFEQRFGPLDGNISTIWKDGDTSALLHPLPRELSDEEWTLTRSVIQGSTHLHKPSPIPPQIMATLGSAIRELDKHIAALDDEQEKVALEIAPGPQRIRGLAGTGKTVLLAMKAAHIHLLYPETKILFTFNTWSLYNQVIDLIAKTYRAYKGTDPNWSVLHVRHALGGLSRPGVYSELCARQGVKLLNWSITQKNDKHKDPFQFYCEHALQRPIVPDYDFILVDEAQEFPKEFFHILYQLSEEPKRIYWAYESLSSLEMPESEELFGVNEQGTPLVSLNGENYEGPIEKDFVLHRSYRCPLEVLMLAHAIGLGIHNPTGPVQMVEDQGYWEATGYEVESGKLQQGEQVVIFRDRKNSPNPVSNLYDKQPLITVNGFQTTETELDWVANSIKNDIKVEGVIPQKILVMPLDTKNAQRYLPGLQKRLFQEDILSTIPGLIEDTVSFAQAGKVTLSTVNRAKGCEAYVVYVIGFDSLYDYIEGIDNRNRAFISLTRSRAWVRITGAGKNMEMAKNEINKILADLPRFNFTIPGREKIPRLASSDRESLAAFIEKMPIEGLALIVEKVLTEYSGMLGEKKTETREDLEALKKRISEVLGENQRSTSDAERYL